MNLKDRLEQVASALNFNRRFGKTTLIAKACKEIDGIMLAANFAEAKKISRDNDITSKSIEMNLQGFRGPFFLDHNAAAVLLEKAANKIGELQQENKNLQEEVEFLRRDNEIKETTIFELRMGDDL